MTEYITTTLDSFEDIQNQLKQLRVRDQNKNAIDHVVKIYGAMSICIDILRGLNGEDYISERCKLPISEMIRRIERYSKQQKYDDSKEAQVIRYVALYDELYSKMYNIIMRMEKKELH